MRLVPLVDLLAVIRTPVDAEVLLVAFADGSSCALHIAQELRTATSFVALDDGEMRLWSDARPSCTHSDVVRSFQAVTFREFIGGER